MTCLSATCSLSTKSIIKSIKFLSCSYDARELTWNLYVLPRGVVQKLGAGLTSVRSRVRLPRSTSEATRLCTYLWLPRVVVSPGKGNPHYMPAWVRGWILDTATQSHAGIAPAGIGHCATVHRPFVSRLSWSSACFVRLPFLLLKRKKEEWMLIFFDAGS